MVFPPDVSDKPLEKEVFEKEKGYTKSWAEWSVLEGEGITQELKFLDTTGTFVTLGDNEEAFITSASIGYANTGARFVDAHINKKAPSGATFPVLYVEVSQNTAGNSAISFPCPIKVNSGERIALDGTVDANAKVRACVSYLKRSKKVT